MDFPQLDLNIWYLDDGTIIGNIGDVHGVLELIASHGPALGLNLNLSKNEIWWPSRSDNVDVFPSDVKRINNAGVKLLGNPIGTEDFTYHFLREKLFIFTEVDSRVREINDAQLELGIFRGCWALAR